MQTTRDGRIRARRTRNLKAAEMTRHVGRVGCDFANNTGGGGVENEHWGWSGEKAPYRLRKESHSETVTHPCGLTNLGQLGSRSGRLRHTGQGPVQENGAPFCRHWWHARIFMCLVHYMWLMADHWCKPTLEAVARTRDRFAFVDAPVSLAQDDCDEVLVLCPD